MKIRILASIVMLLMCISVKAQGFNYGIEAGFLHNIVEVENEKCSHSGKDGFQAGAMVEYTFTNMVTIESGAHFQRKGAKLSGLKNTNQDNIESIDIISANYAQFPILLGYKFNLANSISIEPQIGIYVSVGMGGKTEVYGRDDNFNWRTSVENTFREKHRPHCEMDYSHSRLYDRGITGAVNMRYKHLGLKLGCDLATTNFSWYGNAHYNALYVAASYWIK